MHLSAFLERFFNVFKRKKQPVEEKAQAGFSTPSEYKDFKSKYLPYVAVVVLMAGLGVTIYQVQVMQDIRQKAQEPLTPPVTAPTGNSGASPTPVYLRSDLGGFGGQKDGKVDIQDYNIFVSDFQAYRGR